MKNKLQQFIVKLLAATLAIIMAVPTNVFAMSQRKSNTYTAATSVMGVQTQDDTPEEVANTETSLLKSAVSTEESTDYILEKSASLSKTTGKLDYKIVVKTKDPSQEFTENQTTTFGITENTDLKDLKVEKVQALDADGKEIDVKNTLNTPKAFNNTDNLRTLGVTATKPQYGMVYYLSAQLTEEALKNLEEKSPQLALDITIASPNQDIFQTRYSLETTKIDTTEITIDNDGNLVNQTSDLIEKEDNLHLYKGEYKKEEKTLFQTTPAHLVWTDYINAKDDKEFTINFDLDENQDTENSQINIDYYEARDKGYVLNQSFSKTVDFTNSLNLTIPQGYIAKVSLTTAIKENTNAKEYTFNGVKVANPTYKEEKTEKTEEEQATDDADPLPDNSSKNDGETKPSTDSIADESEQDFSQNPKSDTSAIALNKEAYLENLRDEEKLTGNLERAANEIELALESYNKEETNWDEFKLAIQNIAKEQNLDQTQVEEILQALLAGLNEDKYKVANIDIKEVIKDIPEIQIKDKDKETTTQDNLEEDTPTSEEKKLPETKTLIKEEFAKQKNGEITEEELEKSLAKIREENNIESEAFFNILAEIYHSGADLGLDVLDTNQSDESPAEIDSSKTKEDALAEKLAEENLDVEKFINFLHSYVKEYDLDEDALENILRENETEVKEIIGDFTIDEIVLSVFLKDTDPLVLATDPNSVSVVDSGAANEDFITELEYFTETLTRATNENKLFEIAKTIENDVTTSSDSAIRNNYVGWRIHLPGIDDSGMDIREIKKDKYGYQNMNFSIYAPSGQSLEDYKVVVEDGNGNPVNINNPVWTTKADHRIYSFSIPRKQLSEEGYNIYVVAKAPVKRQNYAIGVKVAPDNNYVLTFRDKFEEQFDEFAKNNPFILKWKDTSDADQYTNGINLVDTRMVYLEPKGWQDLFPYNGFRSVDYNDNVTDTDVMKNTLSMFGNIDKSGQIIWTISETFPAEKLANKNTVGRDAYSATSNGQTLGNPSVQILVPNGAGYDEIDLGSNVDLSTLQNSIGAQPGTIVNYTYTQQVENENKEELTTIRLRSGKEAAIAYKPVLEAAPDNTGGSSSGSDLDYLHKVQTHRDGSGYEIALANDSANTMKAFIPKDLSKNPRHNDPMFDRTGVIVFCLNPGKPEPTKQYGFNGTITRGEWSTAKKDWSEHGKFIAALATANEAKASPLYKGNVNDPYYASLYEYVLRVYWYGQELAEEYNLSEQSYYKVIAYNLYYWIAGENYAQAFKTMNGYVPNYFSSAESRYADELLERIKAGKDWDSVDYDNDIQIFYYGHDKIKSYQNTITGDTRRSSKKGSLSVNKLDQDGKSLPGAAFQLLDADKKPIKTLVTDADGVATFDNLNYGTYYVKEVQAPTGYKFDNKISAAQQVGETNPHVTFPAKNTINEVVFRKINQDNQVLSNIEFSLKRNGQMTSLKAKSGSDGKFGWKGLTPGSYEVVETNLDSQPNYSNNKDKVVARFQVDSYNNIVNQSIMPEFSNSKETDILNKKNEPEKGEVEFTKVDAQSTSTKLAGAEFVLKYKKPNSNTFIELPGSRRVSDSQGRISWSGLDEGEYRVYETKAPSDKYNTDQNIGEKASFKIVKNTNGEYVVEGKSPSTGNITNQEKPREGQGEFELYKKDKETNKSIQDVEFTLTSNGTVYDGQKNFEYKSTKKTDANGYIKFDKLLPGTYTLKESNPAKGYQANDDTWTVTVDSNYKTTINSTSNSGNYNITNETATVTTNIKNSGGTLDLTENGNVYGNVTTSLKKNANDDYQLDMNFTQAKGYNKIHVGFLYSEISKGGVTESDRKNKVESVKDYINNTLKIPATNITYSEYSYKANTEYTGKAYTLFKQVTDPNTYYIIVEITRGEGEYLNTNRSTYIDGYDYLLKEAKKPGLKDNVYHVIYAQNSSIKQKTDGNDVYFNQFSSDVVYNYAGGELTKVKNKLKEVYSPSTSATKTITYTPNTNLTINGSTNQVSKSKTIDPNNGASESVTLTIPNLNTLSASSDYKVLSELKFAGQDLSSIIPTIEINRTVDANTIPKVDIKNQKIEPEKAQITLRKIDKSTNNVLEGAVFDLYSSEYNARYSRNKISTATSDVNGYVSFPYSSNIVSGRTYYVKEVEAPNGYKLPTNPITSVTAGGTNSVKYTEISNEKDNKTRLELYKKDSDGNPLAGATFGLYKGTSIADNAKADYEATTDSNGYIEFNNIDFGQYVLREIKAPENFEKISDFSLNLNEQTVKKDNTIRPTSDSNSSRIEAVEYRDGEVIITAIDEKSPEKASIEFEKRDFDEQDKKLKGAQFELYKVTDGTEKLVEGSLTSSDEDGKFGWGDLDIGSYIVYENQTPVGYPDIADGDKKKVAQFDVKKSDNKLNVENVRYVVGLGELKDGTRIIYNKANEINFKKVNDKKDALQGAKFKLVQVEEYVDGELKALDNQTAAGEYEEKIIKEGVRSDANGRFSFSANKPGRYQVIETTAPAGYQAVPTGGLLVAEFTVEEGSLDIKNIMVNGEYHQDSSKATEVFEIVNKKDVKGQFQVEKLGKDGNPNTQLEGAQFLLKDINTNQYVKTDGTFTRNSFYALTNGAALVSYQNLPTGEYELREFKAPSGYVRTINTWKVIVTSTNTTIALNEADDGNAEFSITNQSSRNPAKLKLINKQNEIEFTKVDTSTDKPLKGVEFEVWWDQQGNIDNRYVNNDKSQYKQYIKVKNTDGTEVFTSDQDGKFKLQNLKTGHYKIYETLPKGYYAAETPTDNEPIADANGEFVKEFFVDIDGDIKKNEKGVVNEDGQELITTIGNTPYTGKFRVQKVGEDGVKELDGASFELYKIVDGTPDKSNPIKPQPVTDTDDKQLTGLVEFANLENGADYLLEETVAPDGYAISKTKWKVSVRDAKVNITPTNGLADFTRTDNTLTLNVVNKKPANGQFKIIKVDDSDKPLSGVEFELTGNGYKETKISGGDGKIEFTQLDSGTYTLKETSTLSDYIMTKQEWTVKVDPNGRTTITPISNLASNNQSAAELFNTAYAASTDEPINFVFIVENVTGRSENTVNKFNEQIGTIAQTLYTRYGDNARIAVISNGYNKQVVEKGWTKASDMYNYQLEMDPDVNPDNDNYGGHLDNAIETAKRELLSNSQNNNIIILEENFDNGWTALYDTGKGTIEATDNVKSVTVIAHDNSPGVIDSKALKGLGLSSDYQTRNEVEFNNLTTTLSKDIPAFKEATVASEAMINIDEIGSLNESNKKKLNDMGYLIANVDTTAGENTDDNVSTIKVVNKKATYPSTGGSGTFIGFALIGTAIMLAGIAYYGIYVNDKNRRRSNRYGK